MPRLTGFWWPVNCVSVYLIFLWAFIKNFSLKNDTCPIFIIAILMILFLSSIPLKRLRLFIIKFNFLQPSLQFTMDEEYDSFFLDVLVERKDGSFITGVYCKPTFMRQNTNWIIFVLKSRKLILISTLAHRALMICSSCNFNSEMENIHVIFRKKWFPGKCD